MTTWKQKMAILALAGIATTSVYAADSVIPADTLTSIKGISGDIALVGGAILALAGVRMAFSWVKRMIS